MEISSSFLIGAIITVLFISASFIAGYKIISGVQYLQGKKKITDIYNEISHLVNYIYYQSEGSSKVITIYLTLNEEILCFINRNDISSYASSASFLPEYDREYLKQIIPEEIEKGRNINMYFHKEGYFPHVFNIKYLVPPYTFCLNKTARLYFENKGEYVGIEPLRE